MGSGAFSAGVTQQAPGEAQPQRSYTGLLGSACFLGFAWVLRRGAGERTSPGPASHPSRPLPHPPQLLCLFLLHYPRIPFRSHRVITIALLCLGTVGREVYQTKPNQTPQLLSVRTTTELRIYSLLRLVPLDLPKQGVDNPERFPLSWQLSKWVLSGVVVPYRSVVLATFRAL